MDWFSGTLEIRWLDGRVESLFDLTFAKAFALCEEHSQRIVDATYHPYSCSMPRKGD